MEKDPFLNFISDLSEKIKISREHKQIMERVNDPKSAADQSKASLENLILKIKEKIETSVVPKSQEINIEEKEKQKESTRVQPITSSLVKVMSEEDNNFNVFVDRLKNILNKPREEKEKIVISSLSANNTQLPSLSTKRENQEEIKISKTPITQNYVHELEKVKDAVQIEKEDTKVTEIKKLIEEYAEKYIKRAVGIMGETGGGTVAAQFAAGGTMDGDLNVNGSFLSGGVNLLDIFALQPDLDNQTLSYNESNYDLSISNGNTVNLSSINTVTNANSASWNSVYTTTNSNSGNWEEAYTNLATNSAIYLSGAFDNRYFYKTSNFNASPNFKYSTGTSFGSLTATLPLNVVAGDSIEFFDADGCWDINGFVVYNNGHRIETYVDRLSCNVRFGIFKLVYTDISYGWRIIPLPRHSEPLTSIIFS